MVKTSVAAGLAFVLLALAAGAVADAQELEPRAYMNTPVGLNFLILGYGYTQGNIAFDAAAPIEDAELTTHTGYLAYARTLDVWGRSGKLDFVLPVVSLSGTAEVFGQPRARDVYGLGDPRVRFSTLLYGGPALSLDEFRDYKPDFIIGASLAVTLPLGEYETRYLVNIGTNRWSIRPELGVSKTWGPMTLEMIPSVTFYTDNRDFFRSTTLQRDPLYAVQAHLSYFTRVGVWAAFDATYYRGGRPSIDGKEGDQVEAVRLGATITLPVNRYNSVKLYGSTGVLHRSESNFNALGVAWQYRWGAGL